MESASLSDLAKFFPYPYRLKRISDMTERIARLRDYFTSGRQKENLTEHRFHPEIYRNLPSLSMRSAIRLREMLRAQRCVFAEDSELIPMRTTKAAPDIFTEEEWERIKSTHTIHERG